MIHICIGARDKILDHFLLRSSAPTIPVWCQLGSLLIGRTEVRERHTRESRADGIAILVNEDAGIVIESDQASVLSSFFLSSPHHHRVPNISSSHFVRNAQARSAGSFGTERSLLLDDYDDSVACCRGGKENTSAHRSTSCELLNVVWLAVPILAACLFFLITATHSTTAAPELSMQLSIVWFEH